MGDGKKRGGARAGAGRKKHIPEAVAEAKLDGRTAVGRSVAGRVLQAAKSEQLWLAMIHLECRRLGIDPATGKLDPKTKGKRSEEGDAVDSGEYQGNFSIIPLTNVLRYLEDRHHGRPVDTVNHIHDKPIEHNVNLNLSERFRLAMEKAEKRVSSIR